MTHTGRTSSPGFPWSTKVSLISFGPNGQVVRGKIALGQMFAQGQGVSRNEETAVMWIRRAANGGDAGAQFNLGNRDSHTDAHGPTTDTSESRIESYKWFKLAAAQGYGQALERCDAATMRMTQEEVSEGNRRAVGFVKS